MESPDRASAGPEADGAVSLWKIASALVRRRRTVIRTVAGFVAIGLVWALLTPAKYLSAGLFRPAASDAAAGQLSNLAAQFGVAVAAGADRDTPDFYAELLTTRSILDAVGERGYALQGAAPKPLYEILEIEEEDPAVAREDVLRWLREDALEVSVGRQSGVVRLEVRTEFPELSKAIGEAVISQLDRFNTGVRQEQASAERRFVESQLAAARDQLTEVEERLKGFLVRNRAIDASPHLQFERDRIAREVTLRQQVVTTLSQSLEQARIAEVRNTPRIVIIQRPQLPAEPEARRRLLKLLVLTVMGVLVGCALALLLELGGPATGADVALQAEVTGWLRAISRTSKR